MSEPFEQAVLAAITDLKNDVNRQGDRHDENMKKLFEIHEVHAADDDRRFQNMDDHFTKLECAAAEDKGSAAATAKAWGIVGGIGSAIVGGLVTFLKFFHHGVK